LHLSKLQEGGVTLNKKSVANLTQISQDQPNWKLSKNQSDEFSSWMSSSNNPDPDDEPWFQVKKAPRELDALTQWLQLPIDSKRQHFDDDWRELVKAEDIAERKLALDALLAVANQEGQWIIERWQTAFYAWADEKLAQETWVKMKDIFASMPDEIFGEVANSIAHWLKNIVRVTVVFEPELIALCARLIKCTSTTAGMEKADPVMSAINHPVGMATEVLISVWFKRNPSDKQGLPDDLKPQLEQLCDKKIIAHPSGRVILAMNLIALFRVDSLWATTHMIPLFNWQSNQVEATNAWEGFLMNKRVHTELMQALKLDFLETAKHYDKLSAHGEQYISMLTYCALHQTKLFTKKQRLEATTSLPNEAAHLIVFSLWLQIRNVVKDKKSAYWSEFIQPCWNITWPKTASNWKSKQLTQRLCQLILDTEDAFPVALSTVLKWLEPLEHTYSEIHRLNDSGFCEAHPKSALDLLNAIVSPNDQIISKEHFEECLMKIKTANLELSQTPNFKRLQAIVPA
jgi:hypothetical protein